MKIENILFRSYFPLKLWSTNRLLREIRKSLSVPKRVLSHEIKIVSLGEDIQDKVWVPSTHRCEEKPNVLQSILLARWHWCWNYQVYSTSLTLTFEILQSIHYYRSFPLIRIQPVLITLAWFCCRGLWGRVEEKFQRSEARSLDTSHSRWRNFHVAASTISAVRWGRASLSVAVLANYIKPNSQSIMIVRIRSILYLSGDRYHRLIE